MMASASMHDLDRVRDVKQDLQFAPQGIADGREDQGYHIHAQLVNIPDSSKKARLFTLPRELRDMIYSDLVQSGQVNILRASKSLHKEATETVLKEGVCRLHLNNLTEQHTPKSHVQEPFPSKIQNFSIRIPVSEKNHIVPSLCLKPFRRLARSDVARQDCHVTFVILDCHMSLDVNRLRSLPTLLAHVETLIQFKALYVKVQVEGPISNEDRRWADRGYQGMKDDLQEIVFNNIRTTLEGTLDEDADEEEESDVKFEGTEASEDEQVPSGRSSRAAPPMPIRQEILRQQPDRPLQWRQDSANIFVLHGEVDDGEDESETCEITIQKFQQRRKKHIQVVEVQYKPTPRDYQCVYVVREEQRMDVGADDIQNVFYNEDGDLKDIQLHGIYKQKPGCCK
ncbi:hypothetical protein OEA41_009055 [Lepraria neglecta]|uniref:Uncharacterized protein n=1 Tax=Lepraria neglecta TaxID=209136 RepID=A0AAD9Z2I0_9LECA|nr:hypothetical protein OEA41_009055 [Lepraria neglecta]